VPGGVERDGGARERRRRSAGPAAPAVDLARALGRFHADDSGCGGEQLRRARPGLRPERAAQADRPRCAGAHPRDRRGTRNVHRSMTEPGLEAVGELAGHVALVTGATRGIGRAIAEELARAGATIAVVGRTAGRAAAVAAELPGAGHRGFACDVSDAEAVDGLIKQVEAEIGSIEILVNNAGVTEDNLLVRLSDDDWDRVLDTNLKGAFHTMRAVARGMMRRRSGRIINVTSVVGLVGN